MKLYVAKIDGLLTASNDRLSASQFLPIKHQLNVANGVQVEKFSGTSQSDARKQLSIDDRIFTLLYTGRFAPIKGVTDLAHALVELNQRDPAFLCLMCGNIEGDRESEKVKKILTDGGIIDKVRFEGFIPNAELSTHLAACDVLVLPSHMEATSISGLEAMAASKPIVGTAIGGIKEIVVDNETGFLVEAKNPKALCDGLLKAKQCNKLADMGAKAFERVTNNFTWSITARKIAHFYQQLLN